MKLTRREFLRASAAFAGALAAGCATTGDEIPVTSAMALRKAKPAGPAKGEWVASTCQGCTQWCAIQIFVQDGRATRVRGNPLSKTNHGHVCPRGHMIPQQVYDPDRIKVPMKRTNPAKGRGVDPKFVPITWDEALDTVAEKMIELRAAGETHKFVYMRGRYSSTSTDLLYGTLPKVFGTPNYFSHSAICAEAEKMGPGLTQGFFGYRDYDLDKTNCLVAWGCDPLASNRMVPNVIRRFGEIVKRGTVIAVDPRLSNVGRQGAGVAADHAGHGRRAGRRHRARDPDRRPVEPRVRRRLQGRQEPLRRRQGGRRGRLRREGDQRRREVVEPGAQGPHAGLGREGNGRSRPRRSCAWRAPWARRRRRSRSGWGRAWRCTRAAPTARWRCTRSTACWARSTPRAASGRSSSVPLAKFPSADKYVDEQAKNASKGKKLDGRGAKDMPAMMGAKPGSGVVTNNVANGMLKDPGAVKVFMSSWSNFNFSCTGADRWDKAMAKVPFFVHMVTNASEMTQFADIVLPVDLQLRRRLVDRQQHGQRPRLRVDPAGGGQAPVGREAGRDRGDVAAGREAQGQGLPEPVRLLLEGVQGSRDRQGTRRATLEFSRDRRQDDQRAALDAQGAAQGRRADRRLGRSSARRACSAARSTRSRRAGAASSTPPRRSSSSTARR